MRGSVVAVATFVITIIAIDGFMAFTTFSSPQPPLGLGPASSHGILESGPISTYPAVWNDPCRLPVHGNTTTVNEIGLGTNPGGGNFSLKQVTSIYEKILNSPAFEGVTQGFGWVTTAWASYEVSGYGGSSEYVAGQFVLLSGNRPVESVQASYDVDTGAVTVVTGLGASCPSELGKASSGTGVTLDKGSPGYYSSGEPVRITYQVSDYNVTGMSVTSSDSCMVSYTILQGFGTYGPEVYDSTKHPGCGGAPLHLTLEPGQSYNQTIAWNQINDSGAPVQPGVYEVMGTYAGDPVNYSSPIGVIYVGLPVSNLTAIALRQQFYFQSYLDNNYVMAGQPVRLVWLLTNNGQQVYNLETSDCSYGYEVFNLTGALVFNSNSESCNSLLGDYVAPPSGGISHVALWNQTDDSGRPVGPGFYHFLLVLHVWSGGHEFNFTAVNDLDSMPTNLASSVGAIVSSPSICTSSCAGSTPRAHAVISFVGNPLLELKNLELYLNGTYVGAMNYYNSSYWLTYVIPFNLPLGGRAVPVVTGATYELVFIATLQNGSTSIAWGYAKAGAAFP